MSKQIVAKPMDVKTRLLLFFICILMAACRPQVSDHSGMCQSIDQICSSQNFSGALLVAYHDRIVIDTAYGFADQQRKIPNTKNTIFPIASVTKLFIKQAILTLAEERKISLDDTLSEYFAEIMFSDQIHISDLIHHQSGLPDIHNRIPRYDNPWLLNDPIQGNALLDSINLFGRLDFAPGSRTAYSNSNYLILARIIEQIAHQPLDHFLKTTIFNPHHLSQTGLYKEHSKLAGHAEGFSTLHGDLVYTPDFNFRNFWGSGNAYSCTHDLYHYYHSTQQFLPAQIAEQLLQHSGLYTGYRAYYKVVPEIGLAIIILSNNSDFQIELLAKKVLSDFAKELLENNMSHSEKTFAGNYCARYNEKEMRVEIAYYSNKYHYNGNELVALNENTFLMPKTGFTKLTFIPDQKGNCTLLVNDNGRLIKFLNTD